MSELKTTEVRKFNGNEHGGRKAVPFIVPYWASIFICCCLATYVVEAPVKYTLSFGGLDKLIYLRDFAIFGVLAASFFSWVVGRSKSPSTIVIYYLLIHLLFGVIYLESLVQAVIGLKVFMPILLGVALFETFKNSCSTALRLMELAFFVTVAGVFLNLAMPMPWVGAVFSSAGGDVELSREWTTGGVVRLAGFTRASYEAATVIAVTSAPLIMRPGAGLLKITAIGVIALVSIGLTTSKASVLAMAVIVIYAVYRHFLEKDSEIKKLPVAFYFYPLVGLGVPIILSLYNFNAKVGGEMWWLLSSFAERINWMWPRAFENIEGFTGWVFGRGIGGIGFAQRFTEAAKYNAADNVMVYLFVTFGLFSLVYYWSVLVGVSKRLRSLPVDLRGCLLAWLIYFCIYGFSTNLIEGAFIGFIIGLLIGAAMSVKVDREAELKDV